MAIRPTRTAAVAVASLLALALAGPAQARPAPPQLRLVAGARAVTVTRFPGEPLFLDLGTSVVAGARPFDIRLTRAGYGAPIVARQRLGGNRTRVVPPGLLRGWSGLRNFLHVSVTDAHRRTVVNRNQDFCPNTYDTARTRPDAPFSSPYPQGCPNNPWTLGSVMGIQQGWSASTLDPYGSGIDLPDGTYSATVSINPTQRAFFGIPAAQASASVTVTVRTVSEPGLQALGRGGTANGRQQNQAPRPAPRPRGLAAAPAASGPRPDLRATPAWDITVLGPGEGGGHDQLGFSANVWNAGPSPLVVDGFRRLGSTSGTDVMDAYQYFFDARGRQVGWAPTGTFQWDPRHGHEHWHFTDFATYRLLRADRRVAVRSGKEAFCLAPTDAINLTVRGARWKPANIGFDASSCGVQSSIAIRETLDTGWGDTYSQSTPGQSFDINGLPNGTYYIEVTANPAGHLLERSRANNRTLRQVILGGRPGARTVRVPPYQGVNAP